MAGTSLMRVTPEQRDLPTLYVEAQRIACDGGGGSLGHPTTYYEIGADGKAVCGYCGKEFIAAGGPADTRSGA